MLTGRLDRRLTITKETFVQAVPPYHEGSWSPQAVATVWAARIRKREDEAFDPETKQRYALTQATFRTRWIPSFTPNDWLLAPNVRWACTCDEVAYRIKGVVEIGRREGIEIQAEVVS